MRAYYISVLLALMFARINSVHAARVLDHHEIGQLCAMAGLVVKAEVGDAADVKTPDGDCAVWDVKVLSVLKGDAKPQSVIHVAGIEEYHKGPGIKGVTEGFPRLSKGDVVYLFLVPKSAPMGYAKYSLTDADWKVIESGARLVMGDDVYDFGQYDPPGPSAGPIQGFVAMTEKTSFKPPIFSPEVFEKQVWASIHAAGEPITRP